MNTNPDLWERLTRAARQAPREEFHASPFGFEARVLAYWRAGNVAADPLSWRLLMQAAAWCAALLVLLSLAASYRAWQERDNSALNIANTVIARSFLP